MMRPPLESLVCPLHQAYPLDVLTLQEISKIWTVDPIALGEAESVRYRGQEGKGGGTYIIPLSKSALYAQMVG